MNAMPPAGTLVRIIADRLADPCSITVPAAAMPGWRQSLACGAPGIALLHVHLAAAGLASWQRAGNWLTFITQGATTVGAGCHPFHGAPAVAHVVACAATLRPGCYSRALDVLDQAVAAEALARASRAHSRINAGQLPALAEFDVIRGLTGFGSYLLRRDPAGPALQAVLEYLVRLTEPVTWHGTDVPGWWTPTGPSGLPDDQYPGGHGNLGMAHGISGPLALLSLAARAGLTVDGHHVAISRICTWLNLWRSASTAVPAWPYWISLPQLHRRQPDPAGPQRLSWCYGTAGLARAQQLAARTTRDPLRQDAAEDALIGALTDPASRAMTTGHSLCHGNAGLARIALAAAGDARPQAATTLRATAANLLAAVQPADRAPDATAASLLARAADGPGLLDGASGIALTILSWSQATAPSSGWDTCLLIS